MPKSDIPPRVLFIAHRDLVRAELAQGWNAREIYDRHRAKLGAASYRQFARFVAGLRVDAGMPVIRHIPKPTLQKETHGGGSFGSGRTFEHGPAPKPGEYTDLLGPDWGKGRK